MFRKQKDVQCHFCQSTQIHPPKDPRNYRCEVCESWNSDKPDPAMRIESLNAQSFSKRASPNKDRLPTKYGPGPFCHTCETNQHLVLNLLSNYLPSPASPEYQKRLEMLPQYTESLHERYPQVCDSCLLRVEDEIRRKDDMARAQALGGWLKQTKGKARQRRVSATLQERETLPKALFMWRIRGCLWGTTLLLFITGYFAVLFDYRPFHRLSPLQPVFPLFMVLSILWTAWDPTYSSGRDVRSAGEKTVLQMILWVSRLATATLLTLQWLHMDYLHISHRPLNSIAKLYFLFSLLLETSVSIACFSILRLQRPPTIRLIASKTDDLGRSRSSTPIPGNDSRASTPFLPGKVTEPDLFASLSLSSQPIVPKSAPVFGVPSLLGSVPSRTPEDADKDEMDWSPTDTNPNSKPPKRSKPRPLKTTTGRGFGLKESLFENTKLVDDVSMQDGTGRSRSRSSPSEWQSVISHIEGWWWVYAAVLVLLMVGVALVAVLVAVVDDEEEEDDAELLEEEDEVVVAEEEVVLLEEEEEEEEEEED
ncbi:hypothetical protein BT96DRAFT_1030994 [Gymnopus androsaceus JB14]|uniref:Ima1 N-terminal domain-containing protein n=1 Tax=Gymnopus androsaceus JB14 TaxID=1447944 RepID=A0A6A4IGR3_9AGAR|nr:hypothetical protein BT96DRAFT_1030994 [Gymnopus androsaceus JB14]